MTEDSLQLSALVVEDEPSLADVYSRHLRRLGFLVDVAFRKETAVKHLWGNAYSVVLLDLALPDSEGVSTLVQVRIAASDTPVVVCTGTASEDTRRACLVEGAAAIVEKPASTEELTAALLKAVRPRPIALLVEDDADASQILMTLLDGYRVVPASTTQEAVVHAGRLKARGSPLALLVVDYMLRRSSVDGLTLLEGLRAAGFGGPAVVVSGADARFLAPKATALGAGYVQKGQREFRRLFLDAVKEAGAPLPGAVVAEGPGGVAQAASAPGS